MKKIRKTGFLKKRSFNIVSRFLLSAFIVISFFYITPLFINFADKNFNNEEFTNNSKKILNKTLNKGETFEEDSTAENDEREPITIWTFRFKKQSSLKTVMILLSNSEFPAPPNEIKIETK